MRVARLHRVIARFYEQALQAAGGSHHPHQRRRPGQAGGPGREADAGAVHHQPEPRPHAEKGWVAVVGTSAAGRAMSATITDAGRSASEQCEWPVESKSTPP